MTGNAELQIALFLIVLLVCAIPLGSYMHKVYAGLPCRLVRFLGPIERFIYRICQIDPTNEMTWKKYLSAMLIFNTLVFLFIYLFMRLQHFLPLNPQHFPGLTPDLAFNIATSFTASADWQAYSGESTMSYLNQMLALSTAKFIAGGTGMCLAVAFMRGIARHEGETLGNFWSDMTRSILYILLPLSFIFALFFTSQGVIQNFKPYISVKVLQPFTYNQADVTEQVLPMGPVASSLAIEQLSVNGGGYFGVNNAHPFENPTPATNFVELIAMILIPVAFCLTFGWMVNDKRQGWAILIAMLIIFIPCIIACNAFEQAGNPALIKAGVNSKPINDSYPAGNMEGKETRFGIVNSSLWQSTATATACGSNNAIVESFTPLGGLISLWLMHTGEVVFGGAGSGLYGMLMLVIVTVFIAGLMVGRRPEYLGKKIETYEMKMASLAVLIMPIGVLLFTAVSVLVKPGLDAIGNPGPHGFTEVLYAFTSLVNTNGSSMAGLNANSPYYNSIGGIAVLIGRYWSAIPTLAIAGSLVRKRITPANSGTLMTYTPLFIVMVACVSTIIGALTFFPALSLGPVVEHLLLWGKYGH